MQFISNIEHGRAPLPWNKVPQLASFLKIPIEELQAANFAIRSDYKSFVKTTKMVRGKKVPTPAVLTGLTPAASAAPAVGAVKDDQLRQIIQRYQAASAGSRKKFVKAALKMLEN